MYNVTDPSFVPPPTVLLEDPEGKHSKKLDLFERIKLGRTTSNKTAPAASNGFFESKVLSRTHADVWAEDGRVFIRDLGSSNGTFVNGERLSEENQQSVPHELHTGDRIDFGVDINNDTGTEIQFKKVVVFVRIAAPGSSASPSRKSGGSPTYTAAQSSQQAGDGGATMTRPMAGAASKYADSTREFNDMRQKAAALEREHSSVSQQVNALTAQITQLSQENHSLQQRTVQLQREAEDERHKAADAVARASRASALAAAAADDGQLRAAIEKNKKLEAEVAALKSQVSRIGGKQAAPRRSSVIGTLFKLLVLLIVLAGVYLFYFDGFAVVDPLAEQHLGVKLSTTVYDAVNQGTAAVNRAKDQYFPQQHTEL
ncbi:hypothetical protein BC828DRAFT_376437 [Blastocladiella britannica]|nr:hypothetical protein BC828DRAFT_376437 [Blastocladiella britannica]